MNKTLGLGVVAFLSCFAFAQRATVIVRPVPVNDEGTRGVASIQNTKKIGIRTPRLTDWQHAARPGPTFRGEIGIDAGDFLNNKRGLLAALVLRDKRELFKVGSDRS